MNPTEKNRIFERIVREELEITTLEARHSDEEDFHSLAVWEIQTIMERAFEAGSAAARRTRRKGN